MLSRCWGIFSANQLAADKGGKCLGSGGGSGSSDGSDGGRVSKCRLFLGAKSTSILDCVRWLVGWLVGPSVPHDAITWKTGYVAIASRGGEGRGN
jgi:hypothetical protein